MAYLSPFHRLQVAIQARAVVTYTHREGEIYKYAVTLTIQISYNACMHTFGVANCFLTNLWDLPAVNSTSAVLVTILKYPPSNLQVQG